MTKPSIAELLIASGHTDFHSSSIMQAIQTLYGDVGANLDERDWPAIMAANNPMSVAEQELKDQWQDAAYLLRNADHLIMQGYSPVSVEFTYRQMAERLDFTYDASWSAGTQYAWLGALSDEELAARATAEAAAAGVPRIAFEFTDTAANLDVSHAGTLSFSVAGASQSVSAGDVALTPGAELKEGFVTLTRDSGAATTTDDYVVVGTDVAINMRNFGSEPITSDRLIILGNGNDNIASGDSNDTVYGGGGNDTIFGNQGNDLIRGGAGADTITGGAGADNLNGGDGNDVFIIAAAADHGGAETITGGLGHDTIRFTSTTANETLTLAAGVTDVDNVITVEISNEAGSSTGNTALNVTAAALLGTLGVNLAGNSGANTLTGTANTDTIHGLTGNDIIVGGGGADSLDGGMGNDSFIFANSAELMAVWSVNGNVHQDTITVTAQITAAVHLGTDANIRTVESLVLAGGSTAAVTLDTQMTSVTLGAAGSVVLTTAGQDVTGSAGADTVNTGSLMSFVNTVLALDADTDVLVVATNNSDLSGINAGAATTAETLIISGLANTRMTTAQHAGFNTITATGTGAAAETITLSGNGAVTTLAAIENYVILDDSTNARTVTVSAAGTSVSATSATDAVTFNLGGLTYTGTVTGQGAIDDILSLSTGANITGGTITNVEALTLANNASVTMTAAQYSGFTGGITAGGGAEQITLTSELGGAAILNANVETFVLAAGAANSVTSGANGQTINAGALADAETLTLAGTHNVTASLVAGDLTSISTGNITVNATTGTNVITTGGGNDTINAGGGDDIISGGGGADFLDGGEGADVIDGGAGADWIMLGGGADVLVLNQTATADTITDYTVADDTIHLSKAVYTSLAAAVGAVDLGAEFATLADVNALDGGSVAASTNANDFIFLRGTGALYYNADGATAGGLVLVGTFQGGALLVGTEFTVIA